MTSFAWAAHPSIARRQDGMKSIVPSSVSPEELEGLVRYLQITNAGFLIEVMLYGIHVVLFFLCCYVLLARQKRVQWFILGSAFAMFVVSTADTAYTIRCSTTDLPYLIRPASPGEALKRIRPKPALFVTNNFIADILLFHRCYVIWGRPRVILLVALVCLTADSMWGWLMVGISKRDLFAVIQPMYLWSVFALNVAVTSAAGKFFGRIYWVTVYASPQVEPRTKKIYRTIISTLAESAAVYSTSILVYLIWWRFESYGSYSMVMLSVMSRLVSIMPTLMIVQVAFFRDAGPFNRDCISASVEAPAESVILDTIVSRGPAASSNGSSQVGWMIEELDQRAYSNGTTATDEEKQLPKEKTDDDTI